MQQEQEPKHSYQTVKSNLTKHLLLYLKIIQPNTLFLYAILQIY
jgi:hypothetical protein